MRTIVAILISALLAWALASAVRAQEHSTRTQEPSAKAAIQGFESGVAEYLSLRSRATRALPPLYPDARPSELVPVVEAHVRAVRKARNSARVGDVFRPDVVSVFREAIATSLREHRMSVADVLAELEFDAPLVLRKARLNDRLPWLRAASVPICLDSLPRLPWSLSYRLLDRDLVLLDVDLALVVDVLVDALPEINGKRTSAPRFQGDHHVANNNSRTTSYRQP